MTVELALKAGGKKTKPFSLSELSKAIGLVACIGSGLATLAASAQAATIEGYVRFNGTDVQPKMLPVTSDKYVCGTEKDAQNLIMSAKRGIRNVVVSLETPPPGTRMYGFGPPPQIDQKECVFIPRIVVVPAGGTVEFLNSDRLLHNIRSKHIKQNRAFNRTQPRGRTIAITFTKPEIVRVGCDLHPWMRSWVVVADHPFYTITGTDGEFTLGNVPAGQYTLRVWQETLGTVTKEITVGDGGVNGVIVEMKSP